MLSRPLILILIGTLTCSAALAQTPAADASSNHDATPMTLGFTTDLLPIVVSATEDEFGKSGQVWLGVESLRLRLVGADIFMPDGISANNGFTNRRITTYAFIVDKCFGEHYDGWWVGSGFELWMNEMEHEDAPGENVEWNNVAWTLGGGYTWRFWNDFFLAFLLLRQPAVQTIPLGLVAFFQQYDSLWNLYFAALMMTTLPVILIFVLMQRQFIAGITAGATKG